MEYAYVLHRRRYRETSLIVEFLTRSQGRVAAVARGALRPKSALAGVLQPLMPLQIETRGRGELLTLTRAESSGAAMAVAGERLYSVIYVNELLMRLTIAHDPQPALFDLYVACIRNLDGAAAIEPLLRSFERDLLEQIGLGMALEYNAEDGAPISAGADYDYVADRGALLPSSAMPGMRVAGQTLLALAGAIPWTAQSAREAKRLMRYVLDQHLDGRPLAARELFAPARGRTS